MIHNKFTLCVILLLAFGMTSLQAQEALPSSGGNASGSGGSASYTVGQAFYTTIEGENGSEAQGVQQPFEISVVTGVEENYGISLSALAYPNPTDEYLTLEINNFDHSNMSFQLFDMQGKVLQSKRINGSHTTIAMSDLAHATYIVKVYAMSGNSSNKEVKTFKIIKN